MQPSYVIARGWEGIIIGQLIGRVLFEDVTFRVKVLGQMVS